jgi:hypothetical protein
MGVINENEGNGGRIGDGGRRDERGRKQGEEKKGKGKQETQPTPVAKERQAGQAQAR